jgi:hypothetical protein
MSASPNTQKILDLADFRLEVYGVLVEKKIHGG